MAEVSVTKQADNKAHGIKRLLKAARRMTVLGSEKATALGPTIQNNLTILSTCGCGSCPRCAVNAAAVVVNTAIALIGMRRKDKGPEQNKRCGQDHEDHTGHNHG